MIAKRDTTPDLLTRTIDERQPGPLQLQNV